MNQDLWVFGYGSLMWRPGFDFEEQHLAYVKGYHRSLCVFSHVHRGTPDRPGIVLGLDRGGSCRGVAFRISAMRRFMTLEYLRAREQVTAVYRETFLTATLDHGEKVACAAYIVDRKHPQYAGRLPEAELARLVLQGQGISGKNTDYVRATNQHLLAVGVKDPVLTRLSNLLSASALGHVSVP